MKRRVCIVTGAGGAIGRAAAIELAARGFAVALVGRTRATLDETAAAIEGALPIVADVVDPTAMADVVAQTLARFGQIDAIVYAAGVAPSRAIESTDAELWRRVIDTNLSGAFYLTRAAWSELLQTRGGVVLVGSEAGRDPFPGFIAYASAKAGLHMLAQTLHREGKAAGVRAWCVAPAAVETPMFRALVPVEQFDVSQTLSPADVARTIAACLDGDLRHASGETIYVHRH